MASVSDVTAVEVEIGQAAATAQQAKPLIPVESLFRDRPTAVGR